jgi:steroid delta-isomerase-like uncharacterized protein
MPEAAEDAERLVNAYLDVWDEQDYSKIPELVSESFQMHGPVTPEGGIHGRDGLELWMREVTSSFPDFQTDVLNMLSSDDVVMCEAIVTGTHGGKFDGVPPTGREVEIRAMEKYRIADGKVQEHRVYFDQQEMAEQLGSQTNENESLVESRSFLSYSITSWHREWP